MPVLYNEPAMRSLHVNRISQVERPAQGPANAVAVELIGKRDYCQVSERAVAEEEYCGGGENLTRLI